MSAEDHAESPRGLEVWLDGRFVPLEQANVSVFDAGFQHAVGLFETMRAQNGRVFRLRAHLARLDESARILRLSESLQTSPLATAVQETLDRNQLEDARVRLTLTGGALNRRLDDAGRSDPTILIHAQPRTTYPDALYTQGIRVVVANDRLSPFDSHSGHKTLAYWPRLAALQAAGAHGASEALWFTVSNHLASGSTSNVFLVREGTILMPPARGEESDGALPAPVLPGITRAALVEVAREHGIALEHRLVDIEDVLGADELLLSNSGWGVLPVVGVEKESIGAGVPGPVFAALRSGLDALLERETAFDLEPDPTS